MASNSRLVYSTHRKCPECGDWYEVKYDHCPECCMAPDSDGD